MHEFKVGDTVWIINDGGDNTEYAEEQYGGYMGPFVIAEIYAPYRTLVARLKKPGGPVLLNGAFLRRLRPDVFMTAARRAVDGAA